eukprot:9478243-Pyramimonas_sp.AAC.1
MPRLPWSAQGWPARASSSLEAVRSLLACCLTPTPAPSRSHPSACGGSVWPACARWDSAV